MTAAAADHATLHRRAPAADPGTGRTHALDPAAAGWDWVGFHEYRLGPGDGFELPPATLETAVVALEGSITLDVGGERRSSVGSRDSVFGGAPPPLMLVGPGTSIAVSAESEGTVVVGTAPSDGAATTRFIDPAGMHVETRGGGNTERRIHHVLPPSELAERLILFEVYTPGGNWSSYPPHKHDTEDPPTEALLEELYYYRFTQPQAFAFARVYTPDRSLDASYAPGDRDVVLVPRGYHPVGQPAGYDGYYLNIMAGPNRAWHFTIDPDHEWLMDWSPPAAE